MTRYTICADGTIYVGEEPIAIDDCTEFPENFNAVQFHTTTGLAGKGEIEWDDGSPNVPLTTLDGIENHIGVTLETLLSRRAAKKIMNDRDRAAYMLGPNGDGT